MAYTTNLLFAAWAATQAALPAAAQSSQNSSYEGCPQGIKNVADSDTHFNSTGSMSFGIGDQEDWRLSYLLRDSRPGFVTWDGFPTVQFLESFISVPESFVSSARVNETKTCMYIMRGLNKTSEAEPGDDASESCKGVLSDECIELLQKAEGPTEDGKCPEARDVEDECGFIAFAGRAANFSNTFCSVEELPHIDLPDGYRSYDTGLAATLMPADNDTESFEVYDLRVRQSFPFFITTRDSEGTHAQILCMAPNNVTEGSREPEKLEFESAARALRPDQGIFMVLATAGLLWLALF